MLAAALSFAVVAVVLAWPVPVALSRAQWTSRSPAVALLLWQAIGLTGGLALIAAFALAGLTAWGSTLGEAWQTLWAHPLTIPAGSSLLAVFSLAIGVVIAVHLVANLVATLIDSQRTRRRHRQLVQLLTSESVDHPHTRIIDHDTPIAWCLPGTVRSLTVLSVGLISTLSREQLTAVIEHERAHAEQRHHLLLIAFRAWRLALPWFPGARRAYAAVALLIEFLADDRARRATSDAAVAQAIRTVAGASAHSLLTNEAGVFDANDSWLAPRLARLSDRAEP